jgi:hypothetical protein
VVDDLAAATAFFVELGLKLQGEGSAAPERRDATSSATTDLCSGRMFAFAVRDEARRPP